MLTTVQIIELQKVSFLVELVGVAVEESEDGKELWNRV
jgi:hypothetical protein